MRVRYVLTAAMGEGDDELERVLKAALREDHGAQQQLARRLVPVLQSELSFVLMRRARGTGRDPRQELTDLVQEALVTLFDHDLRELRRWDPARGRSVESFVRLVARRRARRVLSGWRGNLWAGDATDPTELADVHDDLAVVDELEQRDALSTTVEALLQQMNDRDRRLFEALFVHERDPEEVCEQEGMSRAALNAWRYRMRKQARELAGRMESTTPASLRRASTSKEGRR